MEYKAAYNISVKQKRVKKPFQFYAYIFYRPASGRSCRRRFQGYGFGLGKWIWLIQIAVKGLAHEGEKKINMGIDYRITALLCLMAY